VTSLTALLAMEMGLVGCDKRESPAPVEILIPKPRRTATAKPYFGHTRGPQTMLPDAGSREIGSHTHDTTSDGRSKKQVDVQSLAPLPLVGGPLDRQISDRSAANSSSPTFLSNPKAFLEKDQQVAQLPEAAERTTDASNTFYGSAGIRQERQLQEVATPKDLEGPMAAMAAGSSSVSDTTGKLSSSAKPENTVRIQNAPTFSWPVVGRILSRFGRKDAQHFNDGINIATRAGMPIRAAADGTISYAGNKIPAFGNMLVIKHEQGWSTTYSHTSKILVKKDQKVRRGQIIAHSGATGDVKEAQLHFEIRHHGEPVAPFEYLGP